MSKSYEFRGKTFYCKFMGYRIILTSRVIDFCKNGKGRTIVFPWARYLK